MSAIEPGTRCIYVGPLLWIDKDRPGDCLLSYGCTGVVFNSFREGLLFLEDSSRSSRVVPHDHLYFPAEQPTRHCPKQEATP